MRFLVEYWIVRDTIEIIIGSLVKIWGFCGIIFMGRSLNFGKLHISLSCTYLI